MSQEQERRHESPVKHGDVFHVKGELAGETVAPRDAAMIQSMEHRTYGHISKGGPASVMQSAANQNERAGFITHQDVNAAANQGVSITDTDQTGNRMMTESIARQQIVGKDMKLAPLSPEPVSGKTNITIGEALEATALAAGSRPVDYSDAAAIQAAEVRATGRTNIVPDGVAAAARLQLPAILELRRMTTTHNLARSSVMQAQNCHLIRR
ncbi:hypothetical protein HAX54_006071 [Datura stramonium]|uniref:SMP domain-containing protein n=1 Tax=Datura stramonium TaxID=4076 RepID=A0ABS8WW67_DATST|nr:hypothetical protein [Datura stramonium]